MRLVIGLFAAALLLASPGVEIAGAVVNCKQVNKYLQTGRSVKDVAETMVIDESEVKKCQDEAAAAPAGTAPKPADTEKKEGEK